MKVFILTLLFSFSMFTTGFCNSDICLHYADAMTSLDQIGSILDHGTELSAQDEMVVWLHYFQKCTGMVVIE